MNPPRLLTFFPTLCPSSQSCGLCSEYAPYLTICPPSLGSRSPSLPAWILAGVDSWVASLCPLRPVCRALSAPMVPAPVRLCPAATRCPGCSSGPTWWPGARAPSSTPACLPFLQPGRQASVSRGPAWNVLPLPCPHGSLPHFLLVLVSVSDTSPGPHLKSAPPNPARLSSPSFFSTAFSVPPRICSVVSVFRSLSSLAEQGPLGRAVLVLVYAFKSGPHG